MQHRLYSDLKMATDTNWPAAKVRQTFLEYFEKRGHTIGAYFASSDVQQQPHDRMNYSWLSFFSIYFKLYMASRINQLHMLTTPP